MIPIDEQITLPKFIDTEFPRKKRQLDHIGRLLNGQSKTFISSIRKQYSSNIKLPAQANPGLENQNYSQSINSKFNKELMKRKLKENIMVASLLRQKPKIQQRQYQQIQQFPELQQKAIVPKLTNVQQKIKQYLLLKVSRNQKICLSDQNYLRQVCSPEQLRVQNSKKQKTMQCNLLISPAKVGLDINGSSQQQSRGLTPMKWGMHGKDSSCSIIKEL